MVEIGREKDSGLLGFLKGFFEFYSFLLKYKPSVIVLNCDLPETYGALYVLSQTKIRVVVVEHANPSWPTRRKLGYIVRKILIWRKATFVSVSNHITPPFENHSYSEIVPNFISELGNLAEHDSNDEIKRLIYIGRLTSVYKNPQSLIQISKVTGIPVVFFGTGEMETELRALSQEEGVTAEFRGWVDDPWSEILAEDLLIVPSTREGDGLVIVEAIVKRVPLLLKDVTDLRRFQLADSNYCVSEEEFSDRIRKFRYSLRELKPTREVKNTLIQDRSDSRLLQAWISLLNRL